MDTRLIDFLSRLDATPDSGDAWAETVAFMRNLGALHVAQVMIFTGEPTVAADSDACIYRATMDEQWMADYLPRDILRWSPVALHCAEHVTPCPLGVEMIDLMRNLTPEGVDIVRFSAEAGIRSGVCFPVRDPALGAWGGVAFATGLPRHEFQALMKAIGHVVQVAALCADIRIRELAMRDSARSVRLTARERECLLWLTEGLRPSAIAERLGVKRVTVDLHIANARRKLGAATREQAVANALTLRLIDP